MKKKINKVEDECTLDTPVEIDTIILDKPEVAMLPPKMVIYKKFKALFAGDPDVCVVHDEKKNTFNIVVSNPAKAKCFRYVFPKEIKYKCGDVTILVNGKKKTWDNIVTTEMISGLFTGNPLFSRLIVTKFEDGSEDKLYIVFKNQLVQFKCDNFASPFGGYETMTPEQLYADVMNGTIGGAVFVATEVK